MTGWSVMLRGIRHRSGRSLVVLLLAAFAILACVLVPAYGRAAAQSVLTDAVLAAPQTAASLTISAESSAAGAQGGAFDPAQQSVAEAKVFVDGALAKAPSLARVVDRPITSVESDVRVADHAALLTWRLGVCDRLEITDGQCAIDSEQAVVSERSAALAGLKVGDRIPLDRAKSLQVTGFYRPREPSSVYWGNSAYFAHAEGSRLDAVFAGSEDDVRAAATSAITAKLTYPLKPEAVRLDAMSGLRSELGALGLALNAVELKLETALLAIADEVARDQAALTASVPVIAVPLLLLAFVVLFLIVAALAEDRAPELALARLRGFPAVRVARFGLGETLFLIVLGAPLGLVGGLALTELTARTLLAPGTHVEPRWPVYVAAAAGLAFAIVAAWLATRRISGRGVLTLLRRVPQRATAKSGVAEAIVGTLAVVGLVAALQDSGGSVKLLAPAAIALLAGLIAGRLLTGWARLRLAIARRRGHLAGLLAAAQLARRPGAARMA
ncbi:FtsX-like permease family protein, partial [Allorhizocola rhizosphaerae]|uniref:FtsX-like permease family protein n=1 Tax=Allorhizocola rhizosphaerae TaxID=1872709 RepID=UPI0013C2A06C